MTKVLVKAQLLRSCYEILGAQKSGKESGVMPVTGGGLFPGGNAQGEKQKGLRSTLLNMWWPGSLHLYIEYTYKYKWSRCGVNV